MKTLSEWLSHISLIHPKMVKLGLARIRLVAERAGLLSLDIPIITVAGTNGKGSTVAALEAIYMASGYKTAAITSPHLLYFNERLRLSALPVEDDLLCLGFSYVSQYLEGEQLTYFEYTLLALLYCVQKSSVDILLLEVGLGGRLDAANILDADVSVITNISLDHMNYLGNTRALIGREKAGVMRKGRPCVIADVDPPESLIAYATEINCQLFLIKKSFFVVEKKGIISILFNDFSLELGETVLKCENIAAAIVAAFLLKETLPLSLDKLPSRLSQLALPGRQELLYCNDIPVYLDVAHNPASAQYLAEFLQGIPCFGKTYAIFGVLETKDYMGILDVISDCIDVYFLANLKNEKTQINNVLSDYLNKTHSKRCYTKVSISSAFQAAMSKATRQDRIVVFGSFYAVGEVMTHIKTSCDIKANELETGVLGGGK